MFSIIFVTDDTTVYVTDGQNYIKIEDKKYRDCSPIVGAIPEPSSRDLRDKIRKRLPGYQELYVKEIQVGDRLVRDSPDGNIAAITMPVNNIIVVVGNINDALNVARERGYLI